MGQRGSRRDAAGRETRRCRRPPPASHVIARRRRRRGNPERYADRSGLPCYARNDEGGRSHPFSPPLVGGAGGGGGATTPASNPALPVAKASARRAPSIAWNRGWSRARRSSAGPQKVTRGGGGRWCSSPSRRPMEKSRYTCHPRSGAGASGPKSRRNLEACRTASP